MNYCFTLSYNLPSEVEKATKLLYDLNDRNDFEHLIVDLGFPITVGDRIPSDMDKAKAINSLKLREIAKKYGSEYIQMENIGVSQNWTQVYNHIKPGDDDCLIGCDPDEHPTQKNWVRSMGEVLQDEFIGVCSLMMTAHLHLVEGVPRSERFIYGNRVYFFPDGSFNWALIGISGKLFNQIKEIAFPEVAPRYGWIEGCLLEQMKNTPYGWCILPDYMVRHTDYELGDEGAPELLRLWKNDIIFNINKIGQPSFEEWLSHKLREGKL